MKKMIISTILFLFIAGLASAQNVRQSRRRSAGRINETTAPVTKQTSTVAIKPDNKETENANTVNITQLDNRKEYMIDGQLATPTGHEATPINSEQFQSIRKYQQQKKEKE